MRLRLNHEWMLGDRIGAGGFGQVFEARCTSGDVGPAVAKLVSKAPGAQREMLFTDLDGIRNVVPIIDSGETDGHWVLIMPRAQASLRQHITDAGGTMPLEDALAVMADIALALSDMNGKVVHRDLKPENVLLLEGRWCLADFGISRYAEATTAPDTLKYAMSFAYAAPERWRGERATGAADVYALGVIAQELLSGSRPFPGPDVHDFREQHLHADPAPLAGVSTALASIIAECLYKSPGTRPSPANLLARLEAAQRVPSSQGRSRLREANGLNVARMGQDARLASSARSEAERRRDLVRDARASFRRLSEQVRDTIKTDAPTATIRPAQDGGWSASLNGATLSLSGVVAVAEKPWEGWEAPAFNVAAAASIELRVPSNRHDYDGRSHTLWFGDIKVAGRYGWHEAAFMLSPFSRQRSRLAPFSLPPGEAAAKALWTGLAEYQMAWPFTPFSSESLEDFIDRWLGWFADGTRGSLHHPNTMPERPSEGSWRR
ncbi:serine/threonine-protein kinase [Pseudoroseomonas cervicalis]|nr:serine/threonine-protein kinase [Pseudoroseomonas cervicalis]